MKDNRKKTDEKTKIIGQKIVERKVEKEITVKIQKKTKWRV